jgi:hypothetical protein
MLQSLERKTNKMVAKYKINISSAIIQHDIYFQNNMISIQQLLLLLLLSYIGWLMKFHNFDY